MIPVIKTIYVVEYRALPTDHWLLAFPRKEIKLAIADAEYRKSAGFETRIVSFIRNS